MTVKKQPDASEPTEDELMITHVEAIMGPSPDKAPPASGKSKRIEIKHHADGELVTVASAAEEANKALKSMDPDLLGSSIKKVDEIEPVIDPATDSVIEPLDAVQSTPEIKPDPKSEPNALLQDDPHDDYSKLFDPEHKDETEGELIDDLLTERAVEDIIAKESDAVLEAEDAKLKAETGDEVPFVPLKKRQRAHNWLGSIWATKRGKWAILGGGFALMLAIALIPYSRYFILNTAGVRSSLSLTVLDSGTDQPLKNVQVSAAGVSGQTDSNGKIVLRKVRLGATKLLIEKRAFDSVSRNITLGWGSNPLGNIEVKAVGTQYAFVVTDFLSGKPIANAEAASGEGNAKADKDGRIVLTLDTAQKSDDDQVTVEITADKYRKETINLTVNNKEDQAVKMVPTRKHVFVSKRSGTFDVYSIDVDGKNERKIVSGTGLERDDLVLVPHQSDETAALVSTRENVRNSSGYLLSTLYVINTDSGDLVKIDQSEQIQVIGWSSDQHLIYVKIAAGSSGANPKRHRLISFNGKNVADVKELASSNSFNDVVMLGNKVYYAPSNVFQETPKVGLFVVNPDSTEAKTILDKEVYNIFRTDYETFALSTGSDWYTYKVGGTNATASAAPSSQKSRLYTDNATTSKSLWIDQRDGKGVLLAYDKTSKKDDTILSKVGLKTPIYWLGTNYTVFRVNDGRETADYVANIDGGEARKISDVTDTSGVDRWYFY